MVHEVAVKELIIHINIVYDVVGLRILGHGEVLEGADSFRVVSSGSHEYILLTYFIFRRLLVLLLFSSVLFLSRSRFCWWFIRSTR